MKQIKNLEHSPLMNRLIESPDSHANIINNHNANKHSSSSLNKFTKSPYLQKFTQGFALPKRPVHHVPASNDNHDSRIRDPRASETNPSKQVPRADQRSQLLRREEQAVKKDQQLHYSTEKPEIRSKSNISMTMEHKQKTTKIKLPKLDIEYLKTDKKQKGQNNSFSATLEVTTKKKKLSPIQQSSGAQVFFKTKAGTNGSQTKINQDIAIVETNLPHGVKLYCVCDGHGLNGHLVSAFIKQNLIKNLTAALKKNTQEPEKISTLFEQCLAHTNDALLNSEINTELSGSTVIAVFVHKDTIYSFNIGDSRAILISENEDNNQHYHVISLSEDQKPSREDQKQRILKFGGRVEAQKNQRGHPIGPLRVWMKDLQMPGLAMTRSFGDKAGIKAGTHAQPEIIMHKISPADKFLVIASDGVWQYLENDQIMNITVPFFKKNDLDMAAQKILRISTEIWHKLSYSRDDITVIVVALNHPQAEKELSETPKLGETNQ